MRTSSMRILLAALLALFACSGNASTTPAVSGSAPPEPAPPTTVIQPPQCQADADCAVAFYADPATSGGCCASMTCAHPVATAAEAARLQRAWETECAAVRCAAPDCTGVVDATPVCHEGRCEAKAQ